MRKCERDLYLYISLFNLKSSILLVQLLRSSGIVNVNCQRIAVNITTAVDAKTTKSVIGQSVDIYQFFIFDGVVCGIDFFENAITINLVGIIKSLVECQQFKGVDTLT